MFSMAQISDIIAKIRNSERANFAIFVFAVSICVQPFNENELAAHVAQIYC